MPDYARLISALPQLRSAPHLREVLDRVRRDEDKLIQVRDPRQKEISQAFLKLCRQAALAQFLVASERNPGLRRDLREDIDSRWFQELAHAAPDELRKDTQRLLRSLPVMSSQAAFATAGMQGLLCAAGLAYIWFSRGGPGIWPALGVMAALVAWAVTVARRSRRDREQSQVVFARLRDHLAVRVQLMRRLHPELDRRFS